MQADRPLRVVVAGDATVDWNLSYVPARRGSGFGWDIAAESRAYGQPGGASLLGQLIGATLRAARPPGSAAPEVVFPGRERTTISPLDPTVHHTYSIWSRFDYELPRPAKTDARLAWRVERFLGAQRQTIGSSGEPSGVAPAPALTDTTTAQPLDLLVLDDGNLGFRTDPAAWPWSTGQATQPMPSWVLHKMSEPIATGAVWQHVRQHWTDRTVVVLTVNDLRLSEVAVSRELSWERTAQDLLSALLAGQGVHELSECAHVIVSLGPVGALWLQRGPSGPECALFFDPGLIEGMWGAAHPGGMIGYTSCLTAAVAAQLVLHPASPDFARAIQSGIGAMRRLHQHGYGAPEASGREVQLAFPFPLVADEILRQPSPCAVVSVPRTCATDPSSSTAGGVWTILESRYPGDLAALAERVGLQGVKAVLGDVPYAEFGRLLTMDRREIESLRSIRTLVAEYLQQPSPERPLCIAVFGAPGSGKSFGITEVSKSLPDRIRRLVFNVSQFSTPDDLLGALHQIRDAGLTGEIPLVFWDEFDTPFGDQPRGWLRYFLVPMQDGRFQSGQLTHPIGRAVFVFAGSTAHRTAEFASSVTSEKSNHMSQIEHTHQASAPTSGAPASPLQMDPATAAAHQFQLAKGPDFVSRLHGYLDVVGPDPRDRTQAADPYYALRRAVYLRAILARTALHLFDHHDSSGDLHIDPGVLRAFVRTSTYRHGVRSMEAVVAMSLLANKRQFERSSLPSQAQLDLHVDGGDFLALVGGAAGV